jgi:hypothetical protein
MTCVHEPAKASFSLRRHFCPIRQQTCWTLHLIRIQQSWSTAFSRRHTQQLEVRPSEAAEGSGCTQQPATAQTVAVIATMPKGDSSGAAVVALAFAPRDGCTSFSLLSHPQGGPHPQRGHRLSPEGLALPAGGPAPKLAAGLCRENRTRCSK